MRGIISMKGEGGISLTLPCFFFSGGAGRSGDYFDGGRGWFFPYFPLFLFFFQAALEGAGIIPMKGEGGFFLIGDTRNVEVPQVPKFIFSLLFFPPPVPPLFASPHGST